MSIADISQWVFRDYQTCKRPKLVQITATATGLCALDHGGNCWRYVDKRELLQLGLDPTQLGWYQLEGDMAAWSTVSKGSKK